MGGHISPAPHMMLLRLTKGGGSTNEKNVCTHEARTNELNFGIQGHKWGAGEMDPTTAAGKCKTSGSQYCTIQQTAFHTKYTSFFEF